MAGLGPGAGQEEETNRLGWKVWVVKLAGLEPDGRGEGSKLRVIPGCLGGGSGEAETLLA